MRVGKTSREAAYPLVFRPVYKDYVWGGVRIIRHFRRNQPKGVYAESWEISDHPDGTTVVANGPWKGRTLSELMMTNARKLLGPRFPAKEFPLLIKLIDARETLSVQVHPDDRAARRWGGEPKTEVWFTLDVNPGSGVYAGLEPGTTRARLLKALHTGQIKKALRFVPLLPGDAIFIPGGRVHAIGSGCLLLEVQRRSNTTYRLYDWNRRDQQHRPRPLHLRHALRVIDWNDSAPVKLAPIRLRATDNLLRERVTRNDFFNIERYLFREALQPVARSRLSSAEVVFVARGRMTITSSGHSYSARAGQTILIPYALRSYTLMPQQLPTELLIIHPVVGKRCQPLRGRKA